MKSKEFVIWLKGFVAGSNNFNLTPAGWDTLKDELEKVDDLDGTPIGSGFGVPNFTPAPMWQNPHYPNPMDNPYKITCSTGSFGTISTQGFVVTTTPGYGSITYNPSTSTTYGYPSGSSWHYTNEGIK